MSAAAPVGAVRDFEAVVVLVVALAPVAPAQPADFQLEAARVELVAAPLANRAVGFLH